MARHTNATLLLSLEVPIETVSKLLGHADIKTTQIYAKVIDRSKRDAVDKLDGLTRLKMKIMQSVIVSMYKWCCKNRILYIG